MIAFYCQGGLGNQLFQYATARRLAMRHQEELVLDPHWFEHPREGETVRPLELMKYGIQLRIATAQEQRRWRPLRHRWAPYLGSLLPLLTIRERGVAYNQSVEAAPPDSYLFGFWQSEKYFKDIREDLLRELQPIAPPSARDVVVIDQMRECTAIGVHVRRGDYVTLNSAAAYHGVCSLDYYQRAITHVASRVDNPGLFIFSDDPDWTRENLRTPHRTHYIAHNAPQDAFQDVRLMSHCRHHVIANSSFSWWGAWLADAQNQIVVAPEKWFQADRPTPDLLPSHWTRL